MITDCPDCQRQFRINARQLSAASGLVQCGFCGKQFNALERLHDRPLPISQLTRSGAISIEDEVIDEPQFEIPESTPQSGSRSTDAYEFLNARGNSTKAERARVVEPLGDNEELVQQLLAQPEPKRSIWGTLLWTLGVLVLCLLTVAQLAWFNRDWLLSRYPQYRQLVVQFCNKYQCELTRERDLGAIVLVNRDVRDHPRFLQTLLVNATIENQSQVVQPYPQIRLTLYDIEGNISGYRVFSPAEYLDNGTDIEAGMPAGIPVHLVLEITGENETAVSFEFHFI